MNTELRIGNWIFDPECEPYYFQVEEIRHGKPFDGWFVVYREGSIKSSEPFPIPLTEEWLLKFGFEKPAHSWIGDIFHLSEWDDYPLNWCVSMNKNNCVLVLKLQYVHQLQNLYFALTGQELNKKEA